MIKGKNIVLRKPVEEDLETVYNLMSNYEDKGEFIPPRFPSLELMKKNFKEKGTWYKSDSDGFLITDKSGEIIGEIGYFKSIPYANGYEVGFQVWKKAERNKGFMTEALKILSAYIFDIEEIMRLQLNIATGNIASWKVAEKAGYTYEGTMRKVFYCRRKHEDMKIYSLLRDECPSLDDVLREE
jgi:[ribosomal protein S5]-alanine N-acetyltransferase